MTFSYYSHSAQVDYRGVATDAPRLKMSHSVTIVVQIYTDQTCFLLHSTAFRQGSNHDLVLYGNCDFKNITTVSFENVCLISSARDAVME